ncbi:hypothetical protein [Methylobacter sp.]|uniref:hypothetical protein n=1 Tax=Methylobacter sp. TaxID=2051955 RepID=UPI003DA474BE
MIDNWILDFETANRNALSTEWFVSPLEYFWPDGKTLSDKLFPGPSSPNSTFDELVSPEIFKNSMQIDFRAKMMVFAFMRQDIAKSYGFEIENGLMHLYRLDFISCLSQWVYVVEGYCRKLFSVASLQNVKTNSWQIPTSGDAALDRLINSLSASLGHYLDGVMFRSTSDFHVEKLNRHLLLHGNVANKSFFSQKNCLILMFILDALVVIEMARNRAFPAIFHEREDESKRIERRKFIYGKELEHAFQDEFLLKAEVLKEHL